MMGKIPGRGTHRSTEAGLLLCLIYSRRSPLESVRLPRKQRRWYQLLRYCFDSERVEVAFLLMT